MKKKSFPRKYAIISTIVKRDDDGTLVSISSNNVWCITDDYSSCCKYLEGLREDYRSYGFFFLADDSDSFAVKIGKNAERIMAIANNFG